MKFQIIVQDVCQSMTSTMGISLRGPDYKLALEFAELQAVRPIYRSGSFAILALGQSVPKSPQNYLKEGGVYVEEHFWPGGTTPGKRTIRISPVRART